MQRKYFADQPETIQALCDKGLELIQKWQPRLHLQDWRYAVCIGEVGDQYCMQVGVDWRNKEFVVTIPPDYIDRERHGRPFVTDMDDDTLVEESILHELLHVCEYPLLGYVEEELEWLVGTNSSVGDRIRPILHDYRETLVSHFARIIIAMEKN